MIPNLLNGYDRILPTIRALIVFLRDRFSTCLATEFHRTFPHERLFRFLKFLAGFPEEAHAR